MEMFKTSLFANACRSKIVSCMRVQSGSRRYLHNSLYRRYVIQAYSTVHFHSGIHVLTLVGFLTSLFTVQRGFVHLPWSLQSQMQASDSLFMDSFDSDILWLNWRKNLRCHGVPATSPKLIENHWQFLSTTPPHWKATESLRLTLWLHRVELWIRDTWLPDRAAVAWKVGVLTRRLSC